MNFVKLVKTWALVVAAFYAFTALVFQSWKIMTNGLSDSQFVMFNLAFVVYIVASWIVHRSENKK